MRFGRPSTRPAPHLGAALALALTLGLTPGAARTQPEPGATPNPSATVQALTTGGATLVRRGLVWLEPQLQVRLARALLDGDATPGSAGDLAEALTRRLDEAANPTLTRLYTATPDPSADEPRRRPLFVSARGLTRSGEELVRWLAGARFHALDLAVPPEVAPISSTSHGNPTSPPNPPALALPPLERIEAAWTASRGEPDRLTATVRHLARETKGAPSPAAPTDVANLPAAPADVANLIDAELALADALARLVLGLAPRPRESQVHADANGRYLSPDTLWREAIATPPSQDELAPLLVAAAEAARADRLDAHLTALLPRHPQYRLLIGAAERYAQRCAAGGFTRVKVPSNDKLARSPDLLRPLQVRLAEEGFFEGEATGLWDAATEGAIAAYRRSRQLRDRPNFDKALVDSLNVSCEDRLATLILNIRRWRHTAWRGEAESVQVNLPAQVVRYFRDHQLVRKERSVVGSDKSFFSKVEQRRIWPSATPILKDTISVVVVNPTWNVPPRIARDAIEPEIAKDPDYLERKNFRVVQTSTGRLFVQEPGPENALGLIKILFPNSESVYLHDTPGKNAFKLPVRALSFGCVRVDNAVEFGAELVRSDRAKRGEAFDPNRIRWLTQHTTKTLAFRIEDPIPVFLEYYTASVDEDGQLWFHPDIYGYDAETFALSAATATAPRSRPAIP